MTNSALRFRERIALSGKTIYEGVTREDTDLWIPSDLLEELLEEGLVGASLSGLPLRTRSKVVKTLVARALGYPAPSSFTKVKPRFPGQDLDVYAQKATNLQVWNEELAPSRRYAIVQIDTGDSIKSVRVISGDELAKLDTTGTLTQKFQARVDPGQPRAELLSPADTAALQGLTAVRERGEGYLRSPSSSPTTEELLPIREVFRLLEGLVGTELDYVGATQERNRGSEVHRAVCDLLGYPFYNDNGQFPDLRHQLLEVKLQTSATIDLGLVLPSSEEPLDLPPLGAHLVRHCDVRYAVICGRVEGATVQVTHVFVSTGEDFLTHFKVFGGKGLNKKLQIPLPRDFFD